MADYRFLLLFALLFCSACSMSRSVIGRYEAHSPLASIGLTIAADSSFDYKFTGEGTGRKRWSCGAWRPAGTNKLFLSSIHHNRLPIHIEEQTAAGEGIVIHLPQDAAWETNAIIRINDCSFAIPKDRTTFSLPFFRKVETISIAVYLDDRILREQASYTCIETESYPVKDPSSNVFHITFPMKQSADLFRCFDLAEFNDTVTVRRNKLKMGQTVLKRVK